MFKCHECDRKISEEYMVILGDVLCMSCAEDFMWDELQELKRNNVREWEEKVSEILGYRILEV